MRMNAVLSNPKHPEYGQFIATVDLVRSLNGEQHFFTDHLRLDSFKRDPEIAAAVKTLRLELEQNTPQQGITMGGLS